MNFLNTLFNKISGLFDFDKEKFTPSNILCIIFAILILWVSFTAINTYVELKVFDSYVKRYKTMDL